MEAKESMGQPAGVKSGSGSSANAMHQSNSEASATPVLVRPDATRAVAAPFITSDTPTARAIAVPIVTTVANSSHLSTPPPYMPDMGTAIVPLSVVANTGSGFGFANTGAGLGFGGLDSMKKKRGRPRKYGPGGSLTLAVTPLSTLAPSPLSPSQKRGRGRPPGSGKNQQLAALGELMLGSAGAGFTPHAITVAAGEDIASRIMSFSQQGPRGICILSANGAISNVTLRQPSISGGTVTYEGRFEILSLSGSFLLTESGGARSRTGGLSVSLAGPDGRVVGGGVAGVLIAASPVQVVVGSFMYNSKKLQSKPAKVQGPTGLSKLSTPNADNPAAESSMNEMSDTKPGVPESPTLNQGTGATVSSNTDSPQG